MPDWSASVGRVYVTRSKESVRVIRGDENGLTCKFMSDGHEYEYDRFGNCPKNRMFDLTGMDLSTNQDGIYQSAHVEKVASNEAAKSTEAKI